MQTTWYLDEPGRGSEMAFGPLQMLNYEWSAQSKCLEAKKLEMARMGRMGRLNLGRWDRLGKNSRQGSSRLNMQLRSQGRDGLITISFI